MSDENKGPETIWARLDVGLGAEQALNLEGEWSCDESIDPAHGCDVEYIRKDISDKRIAELERRLGGGCDANYGGDHAVIKEGSYAFCGDCGETLKGVRYNHAKPDTATGE